MKPICAALAAVLATTLGACGQVPWDQQAAVGGVEQDLDGILYSSFVDGTPKLFVSSNDGSASPLDTGELGAYSADWSPNKTQIAFIGQGNEDPDIYVMSADGTDRQRVLASTAIEGDPNWSADGKSIYFWQSFDDGTWVVQQVNVRTGEVTPVEGTLNGDGMIAVSPVDDRIALARNVKGDLSIEIIGVGKGSASTSIPGGAASPSWSPSGNQLAYLDDDARLHIKDFASGTTVSIQSPSDARLSDVEWGPDESSILVRTSAVPSQGQIQQQDTFVVDTTSGDVTKVNLGSDKSDYFGGISWQ